MDQNKRGPSPWINVAILSASLVALLVWIYIQMRHWKEPGVDAMALALNIIVPILLFLLCSASIWMNWRDSRRAKSGGQSTNLANRLRQQFFQVPHMIRDARFHRRGDADSGVDAAEVVVGKPQAVGAPQVVPLLAEGIRQSGHAAHLHSDGEVLAFHVRRADPALFGVSHDWDFL